MGGYRNDSEPIAFVPHSMEIGMIALWSGSIATIPANHQLCDGSNGTPDLRNKFIRGAPDQGGIDVTGGNDTQSHDFTGNGHTHGIIAAGGIQSGVDFALTTDTAPASGTTDSADNRPAYYQLAYIQRMS